MSKAMDWKLTSISLNPILPTASNVLKSSSMILMAHSSTRICYRKIPKNIRYPRRSKLPPDFGVNLFLKKPQTDSVQDHSDDLTEEKEEEIEVDNGEIVWESEEIEAISSLFRGRIPQKPGKLGRERPLPLPVPYKLRPLGLPAPKKHVNKQVSLSRASISSQIYKNPSFLIGLAKEIKRLSPDQDVSVVLDNCSRYLHKGSLSLTIRELGHLGLPERALQTFCWVQKQPRLFPDDRVLASTVEVLARNHDLKVPFNLEKFTNLASRRVIEAMVKGLIRGGSLKLAWKLISVAKDGKRMLDPSVYAKIILELGKNPDKHVLAEALLDELAEREDLNLSQQDCTAVMKVCIKLGKFEAVESLFNWFRQSGHEPSVVMYTTLIHSRYSESKYREALAVVGKWRVQIVSLISRLIVWL